MASRNGYSQRPELRLYDTTGGTEDYTYWTAGALGYTFEIGPNEFHPPFNAGVVDEYLGRGQAAGAGKGGNREAYYDMLAATADPASHATLKGTAPKGSTLTIRKVFKTATSPVWADDLGSSIGDPLLLDDKLEYRYVTQGDQFDWHVNPSTRPIVDGRTGRETTGRRAAGHRHAEPAGDTGGERVVPAHAVRDVLVRRQAGVRQRPDDRAHRVGRSADRLGPLRAQQRGQVVTQSASFGDNTEDAVLFDPPAGRYTVHIVNYDQVGTTVDEWRNGSVRFRAPMPSTTGETEAWEFTCQPPKGNAGAPRAVVAKRGQQVDLGAACGTSAASKQR
jgi:hypothetical protein